MSDTKPKNSHAWLLYVLEDIEAYAELNKLHTTREALLFARKTLRFDLRSEEAQKNRARIRPV